MEIGVVAGLRRYPIKSVRGEELAAAHVTERGLVGDRAYALQDRASGKIVSVKRPRLWGRLLECSAAVAGEAGPAGGPPTVRITLPDGQTLLTGQDDVAGALSALLDREVTLLATPPDTRDMVIERYWPDIDGLALRDTVTSGAIGLGAPPGTFFDYAPVHLLATSTIERLQMLYPDGLVDLQRFRPNLVIIPSTPPHGVDGFIENDWVGRTLLIGETVRLRVCDPTPRCVVPTLPQGELPRDVGILRAIATRNRPPIPAAGGATQPSLGVYAVVEQGGTIRPGDSARLV